MTNAVEGFTKKACSLLRTGFLLFHSYHWFRITGILNYWVLTYYDTIWWASSSSWRKMFPLAGGRNTTRSVICLHRIVQLYTLQIDIHSRAWLSHDLTRQIPSMTRTDLPADHTWVALWGWMDSDNSGVRSTWSVYPWWIAIDLFQLSSNRWWTT